MDGKTCDMCGANSGGWCRCGDNTDKPEKPRKNVNKVNRELLSACILAVHALNRKPCFEVDCIDPAIRNSYQIASILDKAIANAKGAKS